MISMPSTVEYTCTEISFESWSESEVPNGTTRITLPDSSMLVLDISSTPTYLRKYAVSGNKYYRLKRVNHDEKA